MTRERTIRSAVIPPPVAGWNTRDPISAMDSTYAVELENLITKNGALQLRGGSRIFTASGAKDHLATFVYNSYDKLISYNSVSTTIVDCSSGTAVDISGGLANPTGFRWAYQFKDRIFFTTPASNTDVYHWTGTGNIAASGFTGPAGDDKTLGPMTSYKGRLYFAHRDVTTPTYNLDLWYAGYDVVTGALTQYSLDLIARKGGYFTFIGSTTRAKDFQEDELFCAITNKGEVFVFTGLYPGHTSWQLIGRYFLPSEPIGEKAFFYLGSSLVIATRQGMFTIEQLMGGSVGLGNDSIITGDLSATIKSEFQAIGYQAIFNDDIFQIVPYPNGGYFLVNVLNTTSDATYQLVYNMIEGGWSKFTGWNASSFIVWKNELYYTTSWFSGTAIMKADTGYYDENPVSAGAMIARTVKMRPAYNFFGDPSHKKRFIFAIPHHYQSEGMQLTMDADIDFKNVAATQTVTPDNADTSYKYYAPNVGLAAVGKCASLRIDQSVTTKRFSLQAIEVFWETGTVL